METQTNQQQEKQRDGPPKHTGTDTGMDSDSGEEEVFFNAPPEADQCPKMDTPSSKTNQENEESQSRDTIPVRAVQDESEESLSLFMPLTQEGSQEGSSTQDNQGLENAETNRTVTTGVQGPVGEGKESAGETCQACNTCKESCPNTYLRCHNCNGRTHYVCSHLPPYQITNLVGSRRVYTCEGCTRTRQDIVDVLNKARNDNLTHEKLVNQDILDTNNIEKPVSTAGNSDVNERIDQLETSLVKLVRGLFDDITDSRTDQLTSDLKASRAEVSVMRKELEAKGKRCQELESKIKHKEAQPHAQQPVKVTNCECNGKHREVLAHSLELEEHSEKQQGEILSLKRIITELQADIRRRNQENEELRESMNRNTEKIAELDALLIAKEKALTEAKSHARSLEVQRENTSNQEETTWDTVPMKPLFVKGDDDPLSNFFPCEINTYNTKFESVEHAYQYRKLFDHNMFHEAERVRNIESPVLAKEESAKLLGRTENLQWEEKSTGILRHLLTLKRESSPRFREELEASRGRQILHNVASPFWGTAGRHGKGQNRFGHLLMELRKEWFGNHANSDTGKVQENNKTEKTTATRPNGRASDTQHKPHVMIIGNSVTKYIHEEKLCKEVHTTKRWAATIEEASKVVNEIEEHPNVVVFQLTTNDVKANNPPKVVASYKDLVAATTTKLPAAKIILSSAPFCDNNTKTSADIAMVNASLENAYHGSDVVSIRNRNITAFGKDGIHPLRGGVSRLAGNIKAAVCNVLQIPNVSRPRQPGPRGYTPRPGFTGEFRQQRQIPRWKRQNEGGRRYSDYLPYGRK